MKAEMLPALHLLRDARRYGWKLSERAGDRRSRFVTFERHDEDGRHWVRFDIGCLPEPGEDFFTSYRSPSFFLNTTDGELQGAHLSVRQTVAILRAYSGIGAGS